VKEQDTCNREIFWSSFSTSTTNLEIAKNSFSNTNGVIFHIQAFSAKLFSFISTEDELLLCPDSRFIVWDLC
jgi:hypothetical protein